MFVRALLVVALSATVVPQTLEALTDRSTHVVRARVQRQSSAREAGPAGIYTRSVLQVEEALKGAAASTLVVRQAGGTVGAEQVELPGDAVLREGEEVLVFLSCAPDKDACALIGLAQGKFHLAADGKGALQASRDFAQTSFMGEALSPGPEPYAALAARIRARAGSGQ